MSYYTRSSSSNQSAAQFFSASVLLEDRLQGLSIKDLMHLQELVSCRLSGRPANQILNFRNEEEFASLQRLSSREVEVLTLVASGYTRPEIAQTLKISRNTAAKHVANIYRKLDVESIAEATLIAFRCGIVC